jgi:hypothetical protein
LNLIVGILSDTHLPARGKQLPETLLERFRGADLILHAGDWLNMDVYETLSALAPVEGVAGNGDGDDIVRRFGKKKLLELAGIRVGLVHGHEGPGRTTPERAFAAFRVEKPDLVVFGHSHIPYLSEAEGTLLFNPGSPTDKRRQPRYSFGILTIRNGQFSVEHCYFDKP